MALLRSIYKLIALVVWYIIAALMTVPFHFMGRRGMLNMILITRLWMRGAAKIANLKFKVYGRLPDSGLIVSNHLSYIDAIVEGSLLKIRWAARSDVATWPIIGLVVATAGPIWVDRKMKGASGNALKEFKYTLRRGLSLLIWSEGTTSDGMSGVLPLRSTVFAAALGLKRPIHPILIRYSDPRIAWYGDMTFVPHFFKILSLKEIQAEIYVLDPVYPGTESRKEFAARVHAIMDREYRRIACMSAMGDTPDD
jgi:1-acyl-sn-glycerol-3-phosphate acyltransferase